MTTAQDIKNQIEFSRCKGREEGREEGRAEGLFAVARELIAMGMPLEQIVQVTKLTKEQLATLI